MSSLRQSPLSKSQEKFWPFATIASPVCRATKIFAAFTRLVSQSRAATTNKENFTRVFSSSPPPSYNLVYKHSRALARGYAFISGLYASSPPAILPARLTKELTIGSAYLVCRNNEIMVDAQPINETMWIVWWPFSLPPRRLANSAVIASFSTENEERLPPGPPPSSTLAFRSCWKGGRVMSRDSVFVRSLSSFIMHK